MENVKSNLQTILEEGKFAVTAELGPPKGAGREVIESKIELLKGKIHAANVTDCQTAIVRVSSLATSALMLQQGLEPIMQLTCRDRNRIAMQSDLLGAAVLGIKNVLLLTGDHQKFGNHPAAKGVFDVDSVQLIEMARKMCVEGEFDCGEKVEDPPSLFLGAVENPFADPFEVRAFRLEKKINAGARFIQTQIVYNIEKFERFMEDVRRLGLEKKAYILAGVSPLKSAGMAKYMKNRVPGMDVPDEIIARMEKAEEPKKEGIKVCADVIREVRKIPGVAGVHIMAIEWEEAVPEIMSEAGLEV